MSTAYFTHEDCLSHVTPRGHPEQVARLEAITAALSAPEFDTLDRREAPLGDDAPILRAHPQTYLDRIIKAEPATGFVSLDPDTHMSPGSVNAARRGVGGIVSATDAVLGGEVANAFVACRPPGHHAETQTAMGFCLFGNIAIAAKYALETHGLKRVTIVDFDVHHGNGTQDLVWSDERILFISSHQMPLYPGTGAPDERGAHDNVMNIPLDPETDGGHARRVYDAMVYPRLRDFNPEMIFISAGFDAHAADPLAQLYWQTADFAALTASLCDVAAELCGGRVVSTLEGGYDLTALADSVAAHVRVLMEKGS